jgi:hypothetical protein
MTTKADYTPEEWQAIMQAPMQAAIVVMLASPSGPIGVIQETVAVSRMLAATMQTPGSNALLNAMAAELKDEEGRKIAAPPRPEAGADLAVYKANALEGVKRAAAIVSAKAPADEAAGFRAWLVQAASAVAQAAREGGFLGIGGTQVTPEERAAVAEVATALGVDAPAQP